MDWIVERFVTEASVVGNAPMTFAIAMVVVGWLMYLFVRSQFSTRLDNAASTIALREAQLDDYKQKLSGATPDEARARIEALEARVEAMSPRTLTPKQRETLASGAARSPGHMHIVNDVACADAAPYLADIALALQAAGWQVRRGSVMGPSLNPPTGLAVTFRNPDQLGPSEVALVDALRATDIPFSVMPMPHQFDYRSPSEVYVLVGAKVL